MNFIWLINRNSIFVLIILSNIWFCEFIRFTNVYRSDPITITRGVRWYRFFMDNQANQSPIVNIKFVCLSTAATMVVKTVSVVMTVIWFGLLQLYISIIFLMIRYLEKANDIQSNYLQKRKKRMTNVGSFIVQCPHVHVSKIYSLLTV